MIDRRKPSAPRERVLLPSAKFSDHALGWIAASMGVPESSNESPDFQAGRREHMNNCLSELLGEK